MCCIKGKVVFDVCVCVLCSVYIGQFHNRWLLKISDILFFTFHILIYSELAGIEDGPVEEF